MAAAPGTLPPSAGPVTPTDQANAINAWISALRTQSSAATAPTTPEIGQIWTDTSVSPSVTREWNGTAWVLFGFNGINKLMPDETANVNTIQARGISVFRSTSGTAANVAGPGNSWMYFNLGLSSTGTVQIAVRTLGDEMRMRRQTSGVWGDWFDIITQRNTVGTVSQASGVPTGAVIERGSNADGEFVKWADGTMHCMRSATITANINSATGSMFTYASVAQWTYPALFASAPSVYVSVTGSALPPTIGYVAGTPNTASADYSALSTVSVTSATRTFRLLAVGRWF